MLSLAPGVIEATFGLLRACGDATDECVVYWTGPRDEPGLVDGVVQPRHQAGPDFYEIDASWITEFFLELRAARRTARAQVHTHPTFASHSSTDDCFPLAPHSGFLSLVIPDFATGPVGFDDAYLAEMTAIGEWRIVDPARAIEESSW